MKKLIALILLLSVVTLPVFASTMTDIEGSVNKTAIETLIADGVIDGYKEQDGTYTFRPDQPITRAEVAKLLVCGLEPNIPHTVRPTFTDVDATYWAFDYIEEATRLDIIHGYGNGLFKPQDNITFDQMATMLLNILGYKVVGDDWAMKAYAYALDNKLEVAVESRRATPITRGEAAQMIYNALTCSFVELDDYGTVHKKTTTLGDNFGYKYTVDMDKSSVATFGNYIKHYTRDVMMDEVVSTAKTAYTLHDIEGKLIYVNYVSDTVRYVTEAYAGGKIWYNGEEVTADKIVEDGVKVKLILNDDKVTDVVIWEQTDVTVPHTLEAKHVSGDEFIPDISVVTFYGANYAKVCNKVKEFMIWNMEEKDDGLHLYLYNGVTNPASIDEVVIPVYDTIGYACAKLSFNNKIPVFAIYASDGAIYSIHYQVSDVLYELQAEVDKAVKDINGKEYDNTVIAVELQEYFAKLYPNINKVQVYAGELEHEYNVLFTAWTFNHGAKLIAQGEATITYRTID